MRISSKRTIYLVDACNLSYCVFSGFLGKPAEYEKEAVSWLSGIAELSKDEFFLYFDGPFRNLGVDKANMRKFFCEGEKADYRILEYAVYCKRENRRIAAVTDDRELSLKLSKEKVKVMGCGEFYCIMDKLNKTSK
ncbi:MAG: hypothetical protein Fur0012_00600 [Elusimicrobiota bacterium]